ncbi:hypothetical protein G3573_00660 [Caulobacter sp. 17J65-9]|nr:hypothetical protein [Caulobacter sp. 17J65-9]
MRIGHVMLAGVAAFALTACESKADKVAEHQSNAVEAQSEATAQSMEAQAAAAKSTGTAAGAETAKTLEEKADVTREAGKEKANAIEQEAGKKD